VSALAGLVADMGSADRIELALNDLFSALFDVQRQNGVLMTVEALTRFIANTEAGCVCPDGPSECIRCALRLRLGLPYDSLPFRAVAS
jgi:hypothetical protein